MDGKQYILVVDDEEDIVGSIVRNLCTYCPSKYEPLVAIDGYEALDFMKTRKIALVILDLRMKDLDGISVCREAKKDPVMKNLPIIISSGNIDEAVRRELSELGVQHFLDKPYRMSELVVLMDEVLGRT